MEVCEYTNVQDCYSEELRNTGKCQECEVFEKLGNFEEILKKSASENKKFKWYIVPR
jgi:predicted ATP-dependent serine protease